LGQPRNGWSHETAGLVYGYLGVACFSLTLPVTRWAVAYLDPIIIGLGRALVAAALSGIALLAARPPRPRGRQWLSLLAVAGGVVVGFPLLTAWAMQRVPSSHGAVVLGILPLVTAVIGALRMGDRPSFRFWLAALFGSAVVVVFVADAGSGTLRPADMALAGAILSASLGYTEGARLARHLGGWPVICWALILAAPFVAVPVTVDLHRHIPRNVPWSAWAGFAYVSCFSMFLGLFAWYRGLALGGVARVSQIQLLQPFLTLAASALLLGEHITLGMGIAAVLVIASVAVGRRSPIEKRGASGTGVSRQTATLEGYAECDGD